MGCNCTSTSTTAGTVIGCSQMIPGPDNFPRSVLNVCKDATIPSGTTDVTVLTAGVTLTLPSSPRVGEFTKISAVGGAVTVLPGAFPFADGSTSFVIPIGQTARFTFTAEHTWSVLSS